MPIPAERVDQGEIRHDGLFQDELLLLSAVRGEPAHLLGAGGLHDVALGVVLRGDAALGHGSPDAAAGEEAGNASAAGTHLLRQGALRDQLELQLPLKVLPSELAILAHIGGGHLRDPVLGEQPPQTPVIDTAVVRDDREALGALGQQRLDELDRISRQPESGDGERCAVGNVGHCLRGAGHGLVHSHVSSFATRPLQAQPTGFGPKGIPISSTLS